MANFGISFLPGSDDNRARDPNANGEAPQPVQQAIKVLSLRLPRVVGAQAIAPGPLLANTGSAPRPDVDSVVAQILRKVMPSPQTPAAPVSAPSVPSSLPAPASPVSPAPLSPGYQTPQPPARPVSQSPVPQPPVPRPTPPRPPVTPTPRIIADPSRPPQPLPPPVIKFPEDPTPPPEDLEPGPTTKTDVSEPAPLADTFVDRIRTRKPWSWEQDL